MSTLKPRLHDIIDYLVILILFLAPSVFGLVGTAAVITYILAFLQLALTLLTEFSLGMVSAVALWLRNRIDIFLAVALILMAILVSFPAESSGDYFFAGLGLVLLISWFVANYREPEYGRDTQEA